MNNKFNQTTPQQQIQSPAYSDRQFLHTFSAGAWLPLMQASITAAMVMLGTSVLLYAVNARQVVKPAVILGVITWIAMWLYLQRRWIDLTTLERVLKLDINGDGKIGKATPVEPFVIQLNDINPETKAFSQRRIDLTEVITREKLIEFSTGVVKRRRPISRREWTPRAKKGFSDDEYRAWQTAMIRCGLICSEGAGFTPTRAGLRFFTYWAEQDPSPTDDEIGEEG